MLSHSSFARGFVDPHPKVVRKLKAAKLQHRLMQELETSYNLVLMEEGLVLSRTERKRLLTRVTQTILEDMLAKLKAADAQHRAGPASRG